MSAFVCCNRTFSCIVELAAMQEKPLFNKGRLARRLYRLNVESVNQLYELAKEAPYELQKYICNEGKIHYEPQNGLNNAQRIQAAICWLYQSCEGDCEEQPLYRAVVEIVSKAKKLFAISIGEDENDADEVFNRYAYEHEEEIRDMWN